MNALVLTRDYEAVFKFGDETERLQLEALATCHESVLGMVLRNGVWQSVNGMQGYQGMVRTGEPWDE